MRPREGLAPARRAVHGERHDGGTQSGGSVPLPEVRGEGTRDTTKTRERGEMKYLELAGRTWGEMPNAM